MKLSNLKISTRLVMLISALLAMLVTVGDIGLFGISQTDDALKRVYEDRTQFVQQDVRPAVTALRADDKAQAQQLIQEKIRPLYIPFRAGIEALLQLQLDVAKQEFDAATVLRSNILASVLLAMWFGATRVRSTSRALKHAVAIASGIAQDELNHSITPDGRDEVASEVRNLAGRSAAPAKEIKTLIGVNIERVEQGTALLDQASNTMNDVVSSIRRVTDLMGEISFASHEQSEGASQVGKAVTQMDRVTQQNAALVEDQLVPAAREETTPVASPVPILPSCPSVAVSRRN